MIKVQEIFDALDSLASQSGYFGKVNTHEPDVIVSSGNIVTAIWLQSLGPILSSGLPSGSGRALFVQRIYDSRTEQPQDLVDPEMMKAVDYMMRQYSGNFTLDISQVRAIDLLGQAGIPLGCEAAYVEQQGEAVRVMDIVIPILINDIWNQSP